MPAIPIRCSIACARRTSCGRCRMVGGRRVAGPPTYGRSTRRWPIRRDFRKGRKGRKGRELVRRLLVQESEDAIAALTLEVTEGPRSGGDKVALLVVDLGLGGAGALVARRPPGA